MNKLYFVTRLTGVIMFLLVSCKPANLFGRAESYLTATAFPVSTITPKPTETWTKTALPYSTLTFLESKDFIKEYLTDNSSCKLPCWFDVTPGETTLLEVEELLGYIGVLFDTKGVPGDTPNSTLHGTYGFSLKNITNDIYFEVIDTVVNAILIRSYTYESPEEFRAVWKNYSLKNILKEYGVPNRVLLNITGAYRSGRAYHLWIFYDSKKIMIRYDGATSENSILQVCPVLEGMSSIDITLQDPKFSLPIERFDALLEHIKLPPIETGTSQVLLTIHEATGMNESEFHRLFIQEESLICIETPSNIWDADQ